MSFLPWDKYHQGSMLVKLKSMETKLSEHLKILTINKCKFN